MAFANPTVTALGDISTAFRDVYLPQLLETMWLHSTALGRQFKPRKFNGATMEIQARTSHGHPVRTGRDLSIAFDQTKKFTTGSYVVTASETAASNDFSVNKASVRVSDYDLERAGVGEAIALDMVDRLYRDLLEGFSWKDGVYAQLNQQAVLALVNGTPKSNDATTYASANATVGTSGMRIKVDNGIFGAFKPGLRISIHNPATTRAYRTLDGTKYATFEVIDTNPDDFSVGLAAIDCGTDSATAEYLNYNTAFDMTSHTVADNDEIYILNEKYDGTTGLGYKSVGEWFNTGSTLYTRNRSTAVYRWMNPQVVAGSGGTISMTDFDKLCRVMGYVKPGTEGSAYTVSAPPEIIQALINDVFALVAPQAVMPTSATGGLLARYGFDGVVYHHHTFGAITFIEDHLAPSNRVRFLRVGDWERLHVHGPDGGVKMFPGTHGMFSRAVNSSGQPTNEWQADFTKTQTDICLAPNLQAELNNVTGV